jgi:hypothetical protein
MADRRHTSSTIAGTIMDDKIWAVSSGAVKTVHGQRTPRCQ